MIHWLRRIFASWAGRRDPTGPGAHPRSGPGERSIEPSEPPTPYLLLIEDDWRTHSILRKVFTRLGWNVRSAMTVSGALALLDQLPDAVILDLVLPDGDGVEVLEKVRKMPRPIKIAVTTGVDDPARRAKVESLRPDALLAKPVDLDALVRAIAGDVAVPDLPSDSSEEVKGP